MHVGMWGLAATIVSVAAFPVRLNALTLLTPLLSVLLALAVFAEPFGARAALGAVVLLAGLTGAAWPTRSARQQPSQ